MEGIVPTISAEMTEDFFIFMRWVDAIKKLAVRANAENAKDVQMSLELGAEGIGLCRTEHMFFGPERILAVREMIFSETSENREKALEKTLPFQKQDFYNIFKMMGDRPVNIRLLDPPLHEFLPHTESEQKELATHLGVSLGRVKNIQKNLEEFNPMLGHRGCRLAISFPEIYKMQIRAIIEAGIEVKSLGRIPNIEIMVPLIADHKELKEIKTDILNEIERVFSEKDEKISFKIGTMIELPRAAILAKEIAKEVEFFSFGTNDLTQMTFGLSRDDSGRFLPDYLEKKIFTKDPFVSLDEKGVGFLVDHGVKEGRKGNPNIHLGICGEHGGDPQSIQFCHHIGLDYVSCSPFRIPIARLAAAQAALND